MRVQAYHKRLIHALSADSNADAPLPDSLEWMPAGDHVVHCTVDGEPAEVAVTCTDADAARLDAQLQRQLALASEGKASRPFIDFDHEGKEAAAIPVQFFWQDGIRLKVEWTTEGAEALRGRSYSYFSPEFILGDDKHPSELPEVGPIGALVNTPAFQDIERLAAAKSNPEGSASKHQGKSMQLLMAALAEAKLIPSAKLEDQEAATQVKAALAKCAEDMGEDMKKKDDEIAALKASVASLQAQVDAQLKAAAETMVKEAVDCGRIKDDATLRAKWVDAILKDKDSAKAMLDAIQPPTAQFGHQFQNQRQDQGKSSELKGLARVTAAFAAKQKK